MEHRREYLDTITQLRDSHLPPPPVSDERVATPPPDAETRGKLVLIYHNESIFNTNKGHKWAWGTGEEPIIQSKTKGAGIMVSDFVNQYSGFLRLTESEAALTKAKDASFPTTARVLLEYGADKEGYLNGERFMNNVNDVCKIAKFKHPSEKHMVVFIFNQSSCHRNFADDAINARVMNVQPSGAQPCMRDTVWARNPQKLVDEYGAPKGMEGVLKERGINTSQMLAADMRVVLPNHEIFGAKKTVVENFIEK